MEINEARNRVIDMFCNLRNGYIDHLTYGGKGDAETEADIHALDEVLTALDWYRSQDLISREDVKNDEVLEEIALGFEREFLKTVMMIPKAEHKYSGCSYDIFCEKIDCKGCEAEPKAEYKGDEDAD